MPLHSRAGEAPVSRGTGSQQSLRERNMQKVLDALRNSGSQTQASLARMTGLSAGTVSNIVSALRSDDLVVTRQVVSSKRRAVEVSLMADRRIVIGFDIGRKHLRILASDTSHATFGLRTIALDPGHKPEETLSRANEMLVELLAEANVHPDKVAMCGVALPASLDPRTGKIVQASALPKWAGIRLATLFNEYFDFPVVLEHDATAGALAHVTAGRNPGVHSLAYIKLATGIGLGLAVDGQTYSSTSGLSGEIGHFQFFENTDICYCGHRGCLETASSARRIVADLSHIRPGQVVTIDDIVEGARQGESAVLRILEAAGEALGHALAFVCNLIGPDVVVLGGPPSPAGDVLLEAAVLSARQRALSAAIATTTFVMSDLEEQDEVRGACAVALRHLN